MLKDEKANPKKSENKEKRSLVESTPGIGIFLMTILRFVNTANTKTENNNIIFYALLGPGRLESSCVAFFKTRYKFSEEPLHSREFLKKHHLAVNYLDIWTKNV